MAGYPVNCGKLGVNLHDVETIENHIKGTYKNIIPRITDLFNDPIINKNEITCRLSLALLKVLYGLTPGTTQYKKENIEDFSPEKPTSSKNNPRKR